MSNCRDSDWNCTINIRSCFDCKENNDPESPFNGKSYHVGIIWAIMGNDEFFGIVADTLRSGELVHGIAWHGEAETEVFQYSRGVFSCGVFFLEWFHCCGGCC